MVMSIDLNCDLGEGMPNDEDLMPFISSANVACGFHAGDTGTMQKTIELCLKYNVAIGAHPGFDDKKNFGRVSMNLPDEALQELIQNQLHAIGRICKSMNATLHHVKPHGALYNMAAKDACISQIIATAVFDFDSSLIYYGLSGSNMVKEAARAGLRTAHEVFADRTYQSDGSLTTRGEKNALIANEEDMLNQVMQMISEKSVTSLDGSKVPMQADTICLHGDGVHAVHFARRMASHLKNNGIVVQSLY
jgi:UPF0271 protein